MPEELQPIDSSLVTVGKPVEGGCVYVSFAENPQLPTDAAQKMSELTDFKSVGEISENGFTESKSITSNKHKGWHGSVVLVTQSDEDNTFKLEFIEVARPVVAMMRYGSNAVDTGEDGSISHIKPVVGTDIVVSLVIDELESNGYLRRTVVPKATIDTFDDVAHQQGSLMVYGATFTVIDTGSGTPYEIYRAKPVQAEVLKVENKEAVVKK